MKDFTLILASGSTKLYKKSPTTHIEFNLTSQINQGSYKQLTKAAIHTGTIRNTSYDDSYVQQAATALQPILTSYLVYN